MEQTDEEYRQQINREMVELRERLCTQLTEWHVAPSRPTAYVLLGLAVQCVGDEPEDLEFLIATLMRLATGAEPMIVRTEKPSSGEEN